MNRAFSKKIAILRREFQWLKKQYPLKYLQIEPLTIFNLENSISEEKIIPYKETGISQFFIGDDIHFGILFELHPSYELNEHDIWLTSLHNIKEEHFYYWLLYHEYGHLIDMNTMRKKHNTHFILESIDQHEKHILHLKKMKRSKQIEEQTIYHFYRELPFEKRADTFANEIYQQRKEFLP